MRVGQVCMLVCRVCVCMSVCLSVSMCVLTQRGYLPQKYSKGPAKGIKAEGARGVKGRLTQAQCNDIH